MLRKFFKHGVIYSISTILTRGIAVILVPFYTRVLTPDDYGIMDLLTIAGTLINLTIALEITQGLARYIPEVKNNEEKTEYISTSFLFTIIVFTLFSVLVWIFSEPIGNWMFEGKASVLVLKIAILSIWVNGIFSFLQILLMRDLKPKKNTIVSVVSMAAVVGMTVFFILVLELGLVGVFYGILAGRLIGSVIGFYFSKNYFKFVFKYNRLKELLKFSLPLVPSSVGVFISIYVDRLAIKQLLSLDDVGIYGVGYRVSSVVGLAVIGFSSALGPLIYKYYKRDDTAFTISRIFRLFMLIALSLFLILSIFSKEILIIFTTPAYYSARSVIPLLTLSIMLSSMYIFIPGLAIAKKTKKIAIIHITVAVLNGILNFTLIPFLGIQGAALATLISALVGFILYILLGQRYYRIPFLWKRILLSSILIITIVFLSSFMNLEFVSYIIIRVIIVLVSFLILIFILLTAKERNKIMIKVKSLGIRT